MIRARFKWLVILGATTLVVGLSTWVLRSSPRPTGLEPVLPIRRAGIWLGRVGSGDLSPRLPAESESVMNAQVGDWLYKSDKVRLVVGSSAGDAERQARYGAIIDLSAGDPNADELVDFRPVLYAGKNALRTKVTRITAVDTAPAPHLRIDQVTEDGSITLQTHIQLVQGEPLVDLVTRAENTGRVAVRGVRLGDRVAWPGEPTFAPGLGFVKLTTTAQVPWIGRSGPQLSYALVFTDAPAEVTFRFDRIGPVSQGALSPAADLAPGASHLYHRVLAVEDAGLGRVAEHAWALTGKPFARVEGVLQPAPDWATVAAEEHDGQTALSVATDRQGRYQLALPAGDYDLVLRSTGGRDRQRLRVEPGARMLRGKLVPPQPGTLLFSSVSASGKPLASRWIVRGISPTPDPDFGPTERARGSRDVAYTLTGEGRVDLPPGAYNVIATHGPEYSIFAQNVEVEAGGQTSIRAELERVVDTTGWVACDFHVHQGPSPDSSVPLKDRVIALIAEGVEFVAPSDHNHVTDLGRVIEELHARGELVATTGLEITTRSWGHFNVFPYPPHAPVPRYLDTDPSEIFAMVRSRAPNAVIQVNHPRMRGLGYFNRIELDPETGIAAADGFSFDFDTLEVYNGFDLNDSKAVERDLKEWFQLLNLGYRYTAVGNSDSHRLAYQWVGYPRTYVRVDDDQPAAVHADAIARALKQGAAVVSNGPFIQTSVNGHGPGELITVKGGRLVLTTSVRAPEWMHVDRVEAYVNGVVAASTVGGGPSRGGVQVSWQTGLRLTADSWIVVVVRGKGSLEAVLPRIKAAPFAFTNPIFVDVDGDGVFRPMTRPQKEPK